MEALVRIRKPEQVAEPLRSKLREALKLKACKPPRNDLRLLQLKAELEKHQLAMLKQLEYKNLAKYFAAEYRFDVERKWRFDLYAPRFRLAIELHGGIWRQGYHTRGRGFINDREKINAATEQGIRVLEFWPEAIASGAAAEQVQRVICIALADEVL